MSTAAKTSIAPGELVLVTGGARSGKSQWAEQLATMVVSSPEQVVYVATAGRRDGDDEMDARVARHRERRPHAWQTVEETEDLESVLTQWDQPGTVILIDCLTLWLTNVFLRQYDPDTWTSDAEVTLLDRAERLAKIARASQATVIAVGNEIGYGIVPMDKMSRIFRDLSGGIQQRFGQQAQRIYLTVCGAPITVKSAAGEEER